MQLDVGEGTTVFGDEAELRRMLHVLIGQSGDPNSAKGAPGVVIRRSKDEIRVGVNLGPDTPASFPAERGWLARMATRYGGRLELDGSMQTLVLAADVDRHRREMESLKKELAAAQAQGEAYARELAAVFRSGDTVPGIVGTSGPPSRSSRAPTSMLMASPCWWRRCVPSAPTCAASWQQSGATSFHFGTKREKRARSPRRLQGT